ncbi:MAG TPA: helix-turn-helix domain-containing protein [Thermoanaerobacter sp.]|nr:helix-turn-helix domain-containing protein [Thermoanaerobacter sp.]
MTVRDLKKLLGIGINKAYELTKYKGFPAIHIGRKIIIPKKQLIQWIENQTIIQINEHQSSLEKKYKIL